MAVIYDEYHPTRTGQPRVGLDRRLDLLGILAKQRLEVDLDDVIIIAKSNSIWSAQVDELCVVQTAGNVEDVHG
jgi:hypothetical protein